MHDAVVVGGGPAGTITAGLLAEDHDVIVLEEHDSSGIPMQCAGLVTQDVIDMCGVMPDILGRIRGADVIFPGGGRFEVRFNGIKALLIDRADLDKKLAENALNKGAQIVYGTRYSHHSMSESGISVSTNKGDFESKLLIGADGSGSEIAMYLGNNLPKEYVHGTQADVKHNSGQDGIMTLRIGSEFAPGFFSWEIPFGEMTRVGLCISPGGGTPNDHLKKLLKAASMEDKEILSKYAGKIPLGGRPRSYGERTLLIGDAAGQVKPVSGGGLYPICKAAPILERTVKKSLISNDTSSKYLSIYEKEWKKEIGKELSRGYKIRKMYTNLSDEDFMKVFRAIDRDSMRKVLGSIDIDGPSGVKYQMLRNPQVLARFIPIMLKAMI
jgi:geranylgeranyl reductase family protein